VRLKSGTAGAQSNAPFSSEFENVIVLSDDFYQEVLAHPIPNDLEAVKLLAAAPAVLDLCMWLSYRCFTAKGSDRIPIFGDLGSPVSWVAWSTAGLGASARCSNSG
jgi:hypothetical protein